MGLEVTGDDQIDPGEGVRVKTHPGLCMGYGNCHRFAPDVYPLDDEGYIAVHRLGVPPELAEQAWRGASACPERAITVIGEPERYWVERRNSAGHSHDHSHHHSHDHSHHHGSVP